MGACTSLDCSHIKSLPAPATQLHGMAPEYFSPACLGVPLGLGHRNRLSHAPFLMGWTLVQIAPAVPGASVFWEHRSQP